MIKHDAISIENMAARLAVLANENGLNLTMHLETLTPLAQGNTRAVVTVWPAKGLDGITAIRTMPPRAPGLYDPKDDATVARDREAYGFINATPLLQSLLYDLNLLPESIGREDNTRWAQMHAVVSHWRRYVDAPTISVTEVSPEETDRIRKFFEDSGVSVGIMSSALPEERDAWRGGNSYEASMLRNLLARIFGDGGHYLEEHGLEKALADADERVAEWRLRTAPVAKAPTDDRIIKLWDEACDGWKGAWKGARENLYVKFARLVLDEPQPQIGEPWDSIKYLLDSYPGSVRARPGGGLEDLLGSLCTTFIALRNAAEHSGSALAELDARKDAAYLERNQVVAALAKAHPSGVARTAIEGWSEDWHGCVYIDLPTGQASWHYHDSQAYLFADLGAYQGTWDGHSTEEKYARLARLPIGHPATSSAHWHAGGKPDPHAGSYDCERAALAMGDLTDDELANGAFMHYNVRPPLSDILTGKAATPLAWMTAVKDRIRWLSRSLERALASPDEFRIPVTLPDGRVAKMRKCDLRDEDQVTLVDTNTLPAAGATT